MEKLIIYLYQINIWKWIKSLRVIAFILVSAWESESQESKLFLKSSYWSQETGHVTNVVSWCWEKPRYLSDSKSSEKEKENSVLVATIFRAPTPLSPATCQLPWTLLGFVEEAKIFLYPLSDSGWAWKLSWASHVALVVKKLLANAGDIRNMGLIPG